MSTYSVYCEVYGHPLDCEVQLDDDLTEDEAWDSISDYLLMTLEVTKEG